LHPSIQVFAGDTHCGSHYGLWPKEDTPNRGFSGCKYLLNCWESWLKSLPKKIDILWLMGDLIDGKQSKSRGTHLFTTSLSEQAEGAISVLAPLAERAELIYRVDGTPYHEDYEGALKLLDSELGVDVSRQVIDKDLGTGIINVAHHPAGGTALYGGTKVDKEVVWSRYAAAQGHIPQCRWLVRAHLHWYIMQSTASCIAVQTPCWELQTPHAVKQNYHRFQPDLGGLVMLADKDEPGGYRFQPTLFANPKISVL